MKRALVAVGTLVFASLVLAEPSQTVLAPSGWLYSIRVNADLPLLEVTSRNGDETRDFIVPSTEDLAVETHPRIAYDKSTSSLIAAWHRSGPDGDAVRFAILGKDGLWTDPVTITGDVIAHRLGLQLILTRGLPQTEGGVGPTLVHLVWWKVEDSGQVPEYSLVALENGHITSIEVANLRNLADIAGANSGSDGETETVPKAVHPPLAMARAWGSSQDVDVVFGEPDSTNVTRVRLRPRLVEGLTRMWRPGRISGSLLPKAGLTSADGAPVQSFLLNGRVVLYTPDEQFRYVVFESGVWTPARMIKLDAKLTREELLTHLRSAIDDEEAPATENGAANE